MRRPFRFKTVGWLLNGCLRLIILAFALSGSHLFTQACFAAQKQEPELAKAADIREAEQRLFDLGYWTGPVDNRFDGGSRHALIAFQKVEGRKRTGRLTIEELEALREAQRPLARVTGDAHIEIDLIRQVLFIVMQPVRSGKYCRSRPARESYLRLRGGREPPVLLAASLPYIERSPAGEKARLACFTIRTTSAAE
jgi:hypothetical protein